MYGHSNTSRGLGLRHGSGPRGGCRARAQGRVRRGPGVCISHGMAGQYVESLGTPSCSSRRLLGSAPKRKYKSKSRGMGCATEQGPGSLPVASQSSPARGPSSPSLTHGPQTIPRFPRGLSPTLRLSCVGPVRPSRTAVGLRLQYPRPLRATRCGGILDREPVHVGRIDEVHLVHQGGGGDPPTRAPSLCPATVPLTARASLNGSRNRP